MGSSKVVNATSVSEDGLEFKSKSERRMYELLKDSGLSFEYEPQRFTVMDGFYPRTWYKDEIPQNKKQISIRYKPDFIVNGKRNTYIIEVKGFEVEKYLMRRKLFLRAIKDRDDILFFEVHTVKGMRYCIDRIREYEQSSKEDRGTA